MRISPVFVAVAVALALPSTHSIAQSPQPLAGETAKETGADVEAARLKELGAQFEGIGQVGSRAELQIPEGFIFFGPSGTKTLLKEWGNLIGGNEQGLLTHAQEGWSVVFEFADVGYVKDDDKDQLDADKMLAMFQESEPAVNEARAAAGLAPQHTLGFALPPRYNPETNNLEWAVRFKFGDDAKEQVNHNTKLLGRKGVMEATLLCNPEQLEQIQPHYQQVLAGFNFTQGETYAEYRSGDTVAGYGLVGLVAGGAAVAAGKAGLFAKLGAIFAKFAKFIIGGVVVLFIGIKKLFGGRNNSYTG